MKLAEKFAEKNLKYDADRFILMKNEVDKIYNYFIIDIEKKFDPSEKLLQYNVDTLLINSGVQSTNFTYSEIDRILILLADKLKTNDGFCVKYLYPDGKTHTMFISW